MAEPPAALDEARRRVGLARAELLATLLGSVAAGSALVIWLLVRRGRRLRERLGPSRGVRWPTPPEPTDTGPDR